MKRVYGPNTTNQEALYVLRMFLCQSRQNRQSNLASISNFVPSLSTSRLCSHRSPQRSTMPHKRFSKPAAALSAKRARTSGTDFKQSAPSTPGPEGTPTNNASVYNADHDGAPKPVATNSQVETQANGAQAASAKTRIGRGPIARARKALAGKAGDDGNFNYTRLESAYVLGAQSVLAKLQVQDSGKDAGMTRIENVSHDELDSMLAAMAAEDRVW
jgi:hypothetical protein